MKTVFSGKKCSARRKLKYLCRAASLDKTFWSLAWEAWLGLHPSLLEVTWMWLAGSFADKAVRCDGSSGDGLTHLLITKSRFQPNF